MSRITSSFGKDNRWSVDAKVQYILSDATNRPISGARSDNYFYSMYMMPISLDIREFKQAKNPEDGKNVLVGERQWSESILGKRLQYQSRQT